MVNEATNYSSAKTTPTVDFMESSDLFLPLCPLYA
jgi:hypothetical protein